MVPPGGTGQRDYRPMDALLIRITDELTARFRIPLKEGRDIVEGVGDLMAPPKRWAEVCASVRAFSDPETMRQESEHVLVGAYLFRGKWFPLCGTLADVAGAEGAAHAARHWSGPTAVVLVDLTTIANDMRIAAETCSIDCGDFFDGDLKRTKP